MRPASIQSTRPILRPANYGSNRTFIQRILRTIDPSARSQEKSRILLDQLYKFLIADIYDGAVALQQKCKPKRRTVGVREVELYLRLKMGEDAQPFLDKKVSNGQAPKAKRNK